MKKNADPELVVYVVWSSQLGAEEKHVAEAAELMPDPRARHYWDEDKIIGRAFQDDFGLSEAAWDVWMLFDREARWGDGRPPEPDWWEHQLPELPRERRLDPKRFADHADQLLASEARGGVAE
ncbi:MAG: hypothetical protein V3T72_01295 [Thermoanaerobaculia bacterium]